EILAEGSRGDVASEVSDKLRERLGGTLPAAFAPRLWLLDPKLRLVPRSGVGDIYLEGVDPAEVGGPEVAAADWRPHPFADEPGAKLLATGLRGRWRADGRLELVADHDPGAAAAQQSPEASAAHRAAAELAAADELRSEFTSREKNLSDARRALLARRLGAARRLRGRSKKASPGEGG
ncbi:MAG: hypothetical protein GY842_02245, partial [bacterium]|nr:hypothetical protein [bacterium]